MSTESQVRRFDDYISAITGGLGAPPFDFADKPRCIGYHVAYMLNRTQSMFEWKGLPESIPQRSLELLLQVNGYCAVTEVNGKLYALRGGRGGEPDPYYMPTIYVVANPALNYTAQLKIGEECVVIPNDSLYLGLMPAFRHYATQITEAELSLDIADINTRQALVFSAPDDATRESALKVLGDLRVGKQGVIADNAFLEGIKVQPGSAAAAAGSIRELIEKLQYHWAQFFLFVGLEANYNMKREAINAAETSLNQDALAPLVDDMRKRRQEAAVAINKMYGTNITVDLASAWKTNEEQMEAEIEAIAPEGKADDSEPVRDGTEVSESKDDTEDKKGE